MAGAFSSCASLRCTRRTDLRVYVDMEDVVACLWSFRNEVCNEQVAISHPYGWTRMSSLWIASCDSQPKLFVLDSDARQLLTCCGGYEVSPSCCEFKRMTVGVLIEGVRYILDDCLTHWCVRDVLMMLRSVYPRLATLLPLNKDHSWHVSTASQEALDMTDPLCSVASLKWVVTHCGYDKAKAPTQPCSLNTVCILRGLPFEFKTADVLRFLRIRGIPEEDVRAAEVIRYKNNNRSSGHAKLCISGSFDYDAIFGRLHGAYAGTRYVEVLPARNSGKYSYSLLSQVETVSLWSFIHGEHTQSDDNPGPYCYTGGVGSNCRVEM